MSYTELKSCFTENCKYNEFVVDRCLLKEIQLVGGRCNNYRERADGVIQEEESK
jgi:hypothetical protein